VILIVATGHLASRQARLAAMVALHRSLIWRCGLPLGRTPRSGVALGVANRPRAAGHLNGLPGGGPGWSEEQDYR